MESYEYRMEQLGSEKSCTKYRINMKINNGLCYKNLPFILLYNYNREGIVENPNTEPNSAKQQGDLLENDV